MRSSKSSLAAVAFAALVAAPGLAMAQAAPDPHHPAESTVAPESPAPAGSAQPAPTGAAGMSGMMGMPGMMDMMRMMQMMNQGAAPTPGAGAQDLTMMGMPATDRIEGRIAFLRAELRITDDQAAAWNGFADSLRLQAGKIADARKAIGEASAESAGFERRLAIQETLLSARLEGLRAVKATYGHLKDALTAEQRKTAEELLPMHMGMGRGGMMPPEGPMPTGGTTP